MIADGVSLSLDGVNSGELSEVLTFSYGRHGGVYDQGDWNVQALY